MTASETTHNADIALAPVGDEVVRQLAGWLAWKLGHALESLSPTVYGPNTLSMARSLKQSLEESGFVVVRWSDWERLTATRSDGGQDG